MFQPLNDLVLIQVLDVQASKTIIKPDNAAEVSSKGIVRAIPAFTENSVLVSYIGAPPEREKENPSSYKGVSIGDTVMYSPHGATDVPEMKGFVLVSYPELMGVWKEEKKAKALSAH